MDKDKLNSEVEKLLDLLNKQEASYKKLLDVSRKQSNCLLRTNPLELVKLSEQSEELMNSIKSTAKKSDSAITRISSLLGLGAKNSYTEVIRKLSNAGEALREKINNIAGLIAELAPANYRNALLIRQGMDVENIKLNAIKDKFSTENIYSSNGKLNRKDGLFLDKQV